MSDSNYVGGTKNGKANGQGIFPGQMVTPMRVSGLEPFA